MRVCAHINFGPYTNGHERSDSVDQAISYSRKEVVDSPFIHGSTEESDGCYVMDLYPQCDQCDSAANYHDYPMSRYVVGPRGGLAKEVI